MTAFRSLIWSLAVFFCAGFIAPSLSAQTPTLPGEFPSVVQVRRVSDSGFVTLGVVVDPHWVLVTGNDVDLYKNTPAELKVDDGVNTIAVSNVKLAVAPYAYVFGTPPTGKGNLALLELGTPTSVAPMSVPPPGDNYVGVTATAVWREAGTSPCLTLTKANLTVMTNTQLMSIYGAGVITPEHLGAYDAAQVVAPGHGPLFAPFGSQQAVIGMYSFNSLGGAAYPTVYTRVSEHLTWIQQTITPTSQVVSASEWPSVVQVRTVSPSSYLFSGAVVAPHWVLTMGSAVDAYVGNPEGLVVDDGMHLIPVVNIVMAKAPYAYVASGIPPTGQGNLALLELGSPTSVTPAQLPTPTPVNLYTGYTATAVWHKAGPGALPGPCPVLYKQNGAVISNAQTMSNFGPIGAPITPEHLGVFDPSASSWTVANPRGPLFTVDSGVKVLIGMVSFYAYVSGQPSTLYPTVFTRITEHLTWIQSTISQDLATSKSANRECWPFVVEIQRFDGSAWQHHGSGVVVDSVSVLTAAQLMSWGNAYRVVTYSGSCAAEYGVVSSSKQHEGFMLDPLLYYNNGIAILTLQSPLPSHVIPVGRLTSALAATTNGAMLSVKGTCFKRTDVTVNASFLVATTGSGPMGTHAHGFVNTNGSNAFTGEPGSPILVKNASGCWELAGITAWGLGGESQAVGVDGAAHDVGSYSSWLDNNLTSGTNAAPWCTPVGCESAVSNCGCELEPSGCAPIPTACPSSPPACGALPSGCGTATANPPSHYGVGTPGCNGPHSLGMNQCPTLGSTVTFTVDNIPPQGATGVFMIYENAPTAAELTGVTSPITGDVLWHVDFFLTDPLGAALLSGGSSGCSSVNIDIPNIPWLQDRTLHAQVMWIWPWATSCALPPVNNFNVSTSNGLVFTTY